MIENARATPAVKECWKHRLQVLKKELGADEAPLLEQLLIQQAALCWLKLNLVDVTDLSKHFQGVFEFIESGDAYGLDLSSELQALRNFGADDYGYYSREVEDGFLSRANDYLALARKLGVYLSVHPTRSEHLRTSLGKAHRQSASEVAISHFDRRLGATDAARYAGVDISLPPVVEHVMAFAKKNHVDLLTAANEIRLSKNAVRFRERCEKIDEELADFSGRPSVLALQKLIREIDVVASKWEGDLDEGVKYARREISLRKVWGLGVILESLGLEKITVKDPIIFSTHADLLFLNDLYRSPKKRYTDLN